MLEENNDRGQIDTLKGENDALRRKELEQRKEIARLKELVRRQ